MIKEARAERLRAAGVDTIEKLWKADIEALGAHPAFENDQGFLGQVPLLQGFAQAHAEKQPLIYAADPRIYELQEPIIHMDLEFDGPASEIFLYGMLDHESGKVTSWFEHTRRGQEKLLRQFRDLCKDGATMVTWGGASSDTVQLRRASEKYGISPKWVDQVNWFDLQTEVVYTGNPETQRVYLPVSKFKSERVAQFFGYEKPRLKVKDGYHALRLYRTFKRRPDPRIRDDLVAYNAEDIHHTRIILNGLRALMKDA
ncbi:MAG: ribonuclease H-like domain-containing protein [Thermoplasmatota archaeon]